MIGGQLYDAEIFDIDVTNQDDFKIAVVGKATLKDPPDSDGNTFYGFMYVLDSTICQSYVKYFAPEMIITRVRLYIGTGSDEFGGAFIIYDESD